jgi:hypothetical protein
LPTRSGILVRQADDVAARSRQAGDQAGADRVSSRREHNRNDRRRLLGSQDHASARRDNNNNPALDELGRNLSGALAATLRPAILDRDSTTLDPAEFAKPLREGGDPLALGCGRSRAHVPDGRQLRRLLRVRRKWPRGRSAVEKRDELAAFHLRAHSITSSARSRN